MTSTTRSPLASNPAATVGLLFGYFGGAVMIGGAWSLVPGGSIIVEDNAINYVELDPSTGGVSANTSGFDASRIPMAKVATIDGEIVSVADWRPAFIPGTPGASGADGSNGTNGTNGADGAPGAAGVEGQQGSVGPAGPQGDVGPQGTAGESGILHGNGAPEDGVTGLNSSMKIYQNDTPSDDEAVLYVNTDPASPSTNPQWRGVINR